MLPGPKRAKIRADVHPDTAPGFLVEQSFHVGDVDNVNLFNGSLTLTLPLGGSYPVGGGFSYSLKGRMDPPCQYPESPESDPVYQDENGTDHIFYPTLHHGDAEDVNPAGVTDVRYTRDGSYLRRPCPSPRLGKAG